MGLREYEDEEGDITQSECSSTDQAVNHIAVWTASMSYLDRLDRLFLQAGLSYAWRGNWFLCSFYSEKPCPAGDLRPFHLASCLVWGSDRPWTAVIPLVTHEAWDAGSPTPLLAHLILEDFDFPCLGVLVRVQGIVTKGRLHCEPYEGQLASPGGELGELLVAPRLLGRSGRHGGALFCVSWASVKAKQWQQALLGPAIDVPGVVRPGSFLVVTD